MAATSPKPNLLWRLFVLTGVGTMTVVSVDDDAWESFDDATGHTMSRDAIRALLVGTAVLHTLEGGAAYRSARKEGVQRPGRWGLAAWLWGFPVLLRLHRAKCALRATA